jgi:hypothetical protein
VTPVLETVVPETMATLAQVDLPLFIQAAALVEVAALILVVAGRVAAVVAVAQRAYLPVGPVGAAAMEMLRLAQVRQALRQRQTRAPEAVAVAVVALRQTRLALDMRARLAARALFIFGFSRLNHGKAHYNGKYLCNYFRRQSFKSNCGEA